MKCNKPKGTAWNLWVRSLICDLMRAERVMRAPIEAADLAQELYGENGLLLFLVLAYRLMC